MAGAAAGPADRPASEEGASAEDTGRVATAVSDAIARRLLDLAVADLGPAPAAYCWVVLARRRGSSRAWPATRTTPSSSRTTPRPTTGSTSPTSRDRVSTDSAACGYSYCTGGVMATNPRWRQPLSQWRRTFGAYAEDTRARCGPGRQHLLRHAGAARVRRPAHLAAGPRPRPGPAAAGLFAHLAKHAVAKQPPLGFFAASSSRAPASTSTPSTSSARGSAPSSTSPACTPWPPARTRSARGPGCGRWPPPAGWAASPLPTSRAPWSSSARSGCATRACGSAPGWPLDNYVRPDELSPFEKRHLRDAFQVVQHAQVLARSYPLHYVS